MPLHPVTIDFGEFVGDDALGVTLAHTLTAGPRKLQKGRVLTEDDIAALRLAGIAAVSGVRLQADDATEDAAAAEVASLLAGANSAPRRPYTGRCNLHAATRGVVLVDAATIARLNRIDESVTVGTLPPWTVVRQGQVMATVKIVTLGVKRRVLDLCRMAVDLSAPPLAVAELRPHRVALILSELPGMKQSIFATTAAVTRHRLELLGSRLALELRCAHRPDALESALRHALAAGCDLVMISGATVTKDRCDTVPAAIVAVGGSIERFGMPVEPGNMLLLARMGSVPVLVMPGCARSRRLNGLDWVLHRLLAQLPLDAGDIAAMGVGGLIRNAPEDSDEAEAAPPPSRPAVGPRIAALVLAAGRSQRMGGTNKLLASVAGVPLAARATNAALASRATSVTVVTGFEAEKVEALIAAPGVSVVHNPDYASGMASSLRRGVAALPADIDGVVVLLADMPYIDAAHVDALIEVHATTDGIIIPMHSGQRGNPILWPRRHFAAMQAIAGDKGARELLAQHASEVVAIEMSDTAAFTDVDTQADLIRSASAIP